MSIQKKSLISTLQTAKKANVAKEEISNEVSAAQPTTKLSSKIKPVSKFKPVSKVKPVAKFKPVAKTASKFKPVQKF